MVLAKILECQVLLANCWSCSLTCGLNLHGTMRNFGTIQYTVAYNYKESVLCSFELCFLDATILPSLLIMLELL